MSKIVRALASFIGIMGLVGGIAYAAVQLKPTKALVVKNPPSGPSARSVSWRVSEPTSSNTVVGDPTVNGAKFRIKLTPGGDQCVTMPASGWVGLGTFGFKYKDPTLANGPVKAALIKKAGSGTFLIKTILKGGGVTLVPGNPTASYATNFKIGAGDEYCSGSGTAVPSANDARKFKVARDTTPGTCSISACSPSGAFLDPILD